MDTMWTYQQSAGVKLASVLDKIGFQWNIAEPLHSALHTVVHVVKLKQVLHGIELVLLPRQTRHVNINCIVKLNKLTSAQKVNLQY
jgi:hypothetical protein